MPIVKPSNTTAVKFVLPDALVEELSAYAEWSGASKAKVVRTALRRLFAEDEEWLPEIHMRGGSNDDAEDA